MGCCECADNACGCWRYMRVPNATCQLLCVTKPEIKDLPRGLFELCIQRCSLSQKFGFTFCLTSVPGQKKLLAISVDMEHFGLLRGDRLVSGMKLSNLRDLQRVLDR